MYFLFAAGIASAGPGNIATAGLLAPIAMATALRFNISPFLMAIMVGTGCGAGSLSPIAPTGIIVTGLMDRVGLAGFEVAYAERLIGSIRRELLDHVVVLHERHLRRLGSRLISLTTTNGAPIGLSAETRRIRGPFVKRNLELAAVRGLHHYYLPEAA